VTLTFDPKFELGQDICTVHLTAKFHLPTFNRSEVIMRTNKLTNKDAAENIDLAPLCYRPVGNNYRSSQTVITGKPNRFYWTFWNCFYAVANDQVGKAQYTLPVFTGCEHGCQFGHPCSRAPVNTTREHGLSRAVNAGGVYWAGAFFIRMRRSTGDWWGETQPAVCRWI